MYKISAFILDSNFLGLSNMLNRTYKTLCETRFVVFVNLPKQKQENKYINEYINGMFLLFFVFIRLNPQIYQNEENK